MAIIGVAFGPHSAKQIMAQPAASIQVEVDVQQSELLQSSSAMTSPATTVYYFPLVFGPPIAAPTVNASRPAASGGNFAWQLSWTQPDEPAGASYTILESNSPDMNPILNTYTSSSRSQTISHPPGINNTFYYTVRLNGNALASDPIKVISAYRDDFNDPSSGWDIRRQDFDDTDNVMSYENGHLKMHVRGRWDYFVTSPLADAPPPPYRISTRVKFDGPGNLNTYGIIFGGDNNGGACPTIFPPGGRSTNLSATEQDIFDTLPNSVRAPQAVNDVVDNCLNHYYRMMFLWKDGFGKMLAELKEVHYHSDNNSGRGVALSGDDFLEVLVSSRSANDWNDWSIEVYPDGRINVFSGPDRAFGRISGVGYVHDPAFGFWASTDEYPGSDPLYEYILVEPIN